MKLKSNKTKSAEAKSVVAPRPLARVAARQLSAEEIEMVSGGIGGDVGSATRCGANPTDEGDRDAHH